jgi:hypothetical protein
LTVISFFVKVQVLSVQITFTHPNVSTDDNCFTSALFFANLHAANDSAIFTCAGNPCGTIDAAIHMAKINASVTEKFAINAIAINIHHRKTVHILSFLAMFVISFCSGVASNSTSCDRCAIFPSSVSIHVAMTTHQTLPTATVVHIHRQLFLSPNGTLPGIA